MSDALVAEFRRVLNLTVIACQADAKLEYTDKGYARAKQAHEDARKAQEAFVKTLEYYAGRVK